MLSTPIELVLCYCRIWRIYCRFVDDCMNLCFPQNCFLFGWLHKNRADMRTKLLELFLRTLSRLDCYIYINQAWTFFVSLLSFQIKFKQVTTLLVWVVMYRSSSYSRSAWLKLIRDWRLGRLINKLFFSMYRSSLSFQTKLDQLTNRLVQRVYHPYTESRWKWIPKRWTIFTVLFRVCQKIEDSL